MPFKSEKQRKWMHANKPEMAKKWEKEEKSVEEDRDYKDEYKKFQSSDKAKKYRSELNQYNRKKGTYGNGDGKDASHKGGKIVGFESQSKNRGRAEKSRLKKEAISKDEWAQYPKYARKLKPYMKKLLKVPVRVRVIKQANHNPWIEVRVSRFGKDVIPNDFRKKALKAIGGGRARDMDNITYGNITAGSVSMKHDQWVKLLGNKVKSESVKEATLSKSFFSGYKVTTRNVKKAIQIAKNMKGNMTGAVKTIEKIKKGLSNDSQVMDALRQYNESINEATPKEKGNLKVMKPKFKKTMDKIYKDVASIYQNLGSVEADKLKKAYIAAINRGLNPHTNMFMKHNAQKILDTAMKESVNEAAIAGSQIVKAPTSKLVKIYKQMADERLSSGAALTFRLIAKELIKRKAKLEGGKDCCDNCKDGKQCCSVESVNERKKRDANNLISEFSKSFQKFTVAVNGVATSMYNITGNRTDQKIVMNAFKKHVIPFVKLIDSWNKGQQKNPHLDEGFGSSELMGKKDLAEFEKTRQKNAEVLGYKLTGQTDIKPIKEKSKVTK